MTFTLPDLGYEYTDLEPMVDAKTMEIHHARHHQGYVDNLNKAMEEGKIEGESLGEILMNLEAVPEKNRTAVRNNGGGHFNHSLFWEVIGPRMAEDPAGDLGEAIVKEYKSYDGFKEKFSQAAMSRFGSGWVWLGVDAGGKLVICSTPNQDNPLMKGLVDCECVPILGCDVWEHAYYLKYQNRRAEYLAAWYEVVNWGIVTNKYNQALQQKAKA